MSAHRLRCFSADHENSACASEEVHTAKRATVSVSICDAIPLLMDAALSNRVWLEDFADETVDVPQDLYEVLLAYRKIALQSKRAA